MSLRTRTPRSMARIELVASKEIIKDMRERGYDFKRIHAHLVSEGKITMAYTTFCAYASNMFGKKFKMDMQDYQTSKTQREVKHAQPQKSHAFSVNKNLTLDDMV